MKRSERHTWENIDVVMKQKTKVLVVPVMANRPRLTHHGRNGSDKEGDLTDEHCELDQTEGLS